MKAIFLRALEETEDKDRALRAAIASPEQAMGQTRFDVDPVTFGQVSRSPIAYWVSDRVRSAFTELPAFDSEGRTAKQGLATADDFRFVRLWTEVAPATKAKRWFPFAKGGKFLPFYSDVYLVVDWSEDGRAIRNLLDPLSGRLLSRPQNISFFFRPGLTWPRRTKSELSLRVMPAGCIFADKGPAAFVKEDESNALLGLLAIMRSEVFRALIEVQLAAADARAGGAAHSYEVGIVKRTPVPDVDDGQLGPLLDLARASWSLRRSLDTRTEASHAFHLPVLLQMDGGDSLSDRVGLWIQHVGDIDAELARLQAEIDDRCFELYGIEGADRKQIERGLGGRSAEDDAADSEDDEDETSEPEALDAAPLVAAPLVASLLSWSVGVAFGRFDLRLVAGERPATPEPEPFDPHPACSPGMLTGEDGLPFDAPPAGYAIDFPRDGIFVDDAGTPLDLVASARRVFEHVFDDPAARWDEAAEILGQRDRTLRRWFARDFFGLHLRQYSKSRRKAPIYWPLSTASGSYTLWLYYPRLTADTLFQAVAEHLEPKLRKTQEERLQVDAAQGRAEGREAAKLAKQAGELAELQQGLEEMKAELLRVAALPYKPNLNDGVQITAAPLAKLFQLKAWRKVLETTWKKLEKGEYDWAHLAHAIWPDRVRDKCKTDRSLAIAHDLEELCEVGAAR